MPNSQKHVIKLSLVVGALALVGLFVTSCLPSIFNRPPEPMIAITEGSPYGPPPLEITFDISGSSDPDGEIVSFTFDFADGSEPIAGTDLTQPITHTYLEKGLHFATLTVVDNVGKEALVQMIISVFDPAE
jgi:serine protease